MAAVGNFRGKEAVWSLEPKLHSYIALYDHLRDLACERKEPVIRIEGPSQPGTVYLYRYNKQLNCPTVSYEDGSRETPVCPHPGCPDVGGNGTSCSHFKMDLEEWAKRTHLFQRGTVTKKGIKLLFEAMERERGYTGRTGDQATHDELVRDIGNKCHVNHVLGVVVTQAAEHSSSFEVASLDGFHCIFTCRVAGCRNVTAGKIGRHYACVSHLSDVYNKAPDSTESAVHISKALKKLVRDELKEVYNPKSNRQQKMILQFLYERGTQGYFYACPETDVTLTVDEDLTLHAEFRSENASIRCIHPGCAKRLNRGQTRKTGDQYGVRGGMCDVHKTMGRSNPNYFPVEDYQFTGYGRAATRQATFST